MLYAISHSPLVQALSQWFASLLWPEAATASHELGHHHLGAVASSYVDYGQWPEAARHLD